MAAGAPAHVALKALAATLLLSLGALAVCADDASERGYAACRHQAAAAFDVPEDLVQAIKEVESGESLGAPVSVNRNGTEDIGLMQINSSWLATLRGHGISREGLLDACVNVHVGAWILRRAINDAGGDVWAGVGAYHSPTPARQRNYRTLVAQKLHTIRARALNQRGKER